MNNPFSKAKRPVEPPMAAPEPEMRPFPATGAEWATGDDVPVDSVKVEHLSAAELHERRGKLNEAQIAGINALAALAADRAAGRQ
jgi:hypothetical protein